MGEVPSKARNLQLQVPSTVEFTLLFIIPRTALLSSIPYQAETLDISAHTLARNL